MFLSILDSAQKLTHSSPKEISDDALLLLEFIKEFYMNYPLRGQNSAILNSLFDEIQFYSLSNEDMGEQSTTDSKNSTSAPNSKESEGMIEMIKKSNEEVQEYLFTDSSNKLKSPVKSTKVDIKEREEAQFLKHRAINLAYEQNTIITLIRAPNLSSKVIIRNLTGIHGWLLTEHQVLDTNFLKTILYTDKPFVYRNALTLKGNSKLKDIITNTKTLSDDNKELKHRLEEIVNIVNSDDIANIEEELINIRENDSILQIISLLSQHYKDMNIVFYY